MEKIMGHDSSHLWYSCSVRAMGSSSLQKVLCHRKIPFKSEIPWFGGKVLLSDFLILHSGLFFRANFISLFSELTITLWFTAAGWRQLCEQDILLSYCMAGPASALESGEGRKYLHIFSLWIGWLHDFGVRFWAWTRMVRQIFGPMQTEWKDSTGWRGHC